MGPAFSGALVLVVSGSLVVLLFAVIRFFLPTRASAALAVLLVTSGGIGCLFGLLVQAPFTHQRLQTSAAVITFLGVALTSGLAFAGVAFWASFDFGGAEPRSHDRVHESCP
jgi:hypothetical protein